MSVVTDGGNALTGLRVAVLGPGGVGGLLAALLARGGAAVTCLAGAATAEQLRTAGIRLESAHLGDSTTPVDAAERLTAPVDVLLVTVKATHLDDALERVPADVLGDALVVPLLNGVEHVDHLRRRYPQAGVVPATIRVESTRTAPGVIQHGSPFVTVDLVAVPGLEQRVRRLADALQRVGVTTEVGDDEPAVLWSKLNFLAPLALLTTAARATAGEVRESRREDLVAIVGEVAAVARAEGAPADEEQVVGFFDGVPAGMRSSMQRDAAAGRPLELDAIGGAVVRAATRHGIAVPVTARYVDELRERHPGS
ncbi:ketopantoate reductase [Geodermatophilus siccatus]|uniref:2-dehydropantoate 2-reductase n=1 Tax=Geodermatophilus siccatus TaxID=1137991 RepID=A0A1G9YPX2_9ACTN|nr:2-dehydropantoate 2-reductase [Geodermatophilus siccatus]SDN11092.1 ketopantoate reductase [Geodermatophilus siccatus]